MTEVTGGELLTRPSGSWRTVNYRGKPPDLGLPNKTQD